MVVVYAIQVKRIIAPSQWKSKVNQSECISMIIEQNQVICLQL